MNSDGGSKDGTCQAALEATVPAGVEVLAGPYQGPPGKGSAPSSTALASVVRNGAEGGMV